jgi:hypothetical protein
MSRGPKPTPRCFSCPSHTPPQQPQAPRLPPLRPGLPQLPVPPPLPPLQAHPPAEDTGVSAERGAAGALKRDSTFPSQLSSAQQQRTAGAEDPPFLFFFFGIFCSAIAGVSITAKLLRLEGNLRCPIFEKWDKRRGRRSARWTRAFGRECSGARQQVARAQRAPLIACSAHMATHSSCLRWLAQSRRLTECSSTRLLRVRD